MAGAVVGVLLLILCAFLAWRHRARWLPSLVALAARRRRALAAVQRRLRRARADPLGIEAEEFRVLQEAARVAAAEGVALGEAVLRVLRKQASLPAALLQARAMRIAILRAQLLVQFSNARRFPFRR